jgi:hypothetical protein
MRGRKAIAIGGGAALCAALLAVAPAVGAPETLKKVTPQTLRGGIGTFTPAAADPRLAAALARSGLNATGFRFTPAAAIGKGRAVTVAVRARSGTAAPVADATTPASVANIGIAPVAYNLGVGVGWKRFALSGDVKRIDTGVAPGGREGASAGISYNANKWSTRVQVAADRPVGSAPRTLTGGDSMSLDVGGSYRLTRRLDVTAGLRLRSERNRLDRLEDERRDSQAVYVGTAFRF